jgi:hypothetical protein
MAFKLIFDGFVKKSPSRHSGEGRNPEAIEITGFRVKPGMTNQALFNFLRTHHL